MTRTSVAAAALALAFAMSCCANGQSIEQAGELRAGPSDALTVAEPGLTSTGRKASLLRSLSRRLEAHSHKIEKKSLVVRSGESTIRTYTYADLVRSAASKQPQLAMNTKAAPDNPAARRIHLELPEKRRDDPDLHVTVTGGSNEVGLLLTKKMP